MVRQIELLSPAKNADTAIEAIKHGADAIYIGAAKFGARSSAGNSIDDISRVVEFAHPFGVKVYATVNTLIYDDELKDAERLIRQLYRIGVDALIVQDMGILRMDIPPIQLHASTQCDTRTVEKAVFLDKVGFSQIVLARELSEVEIRNICQSVDARIECFVHGALCVSYSGRCNASCAFKGRSANRGECAQICRLPYNVYDRTNRIMHDKHILSLKDFNQSSRLERLLDAGVSSLKIEGRLKDIPYVKNITAYYNNLLNDICMKYPEKYSRCSHGKVELDFEPNPEKSFNRGFTHYFFEGREQSGKMASLDTPKSIGEIVGTIKESTPKGIVMTGKVKLTNGDGLVYFDHNSELHGFRANKVDGNRIYTLEKTNIPKGTVIYRNFDKAFNDLLLKESATHNLKISITMHRMPGGVITDIIDETGSQVSITTKLDIEVAKTDQTEARKRVFSKTGDTPYRLEKLDLTDTANIFIPASVLASIRRQAIGTLTSAKRMRYQFEYRKKEDLSAEYVSKKLTYSDNVSNKLASLFYKQHGVETIENAMEVSEKKEQHPILMTTRYCIRRELGCCLKGSNADRIGREINMESGNIRMSVEFDCKNCQMILRKL